MTYDRRRMVEFINRELIKKLPDCGLDVEAVTDAQKGSLQFLVTHGGIDLVCFNFNEPSATDDPQHIGRCAFNSRYIPDEDDEDYGETDTNDVNIQMGGQVQVDRADLWIKFGIDPHYHKKQLGDLVDAMVQIINTRIARAKVRANQ